jgi:uncharacterized protein
MRARLLAATVLSAFWSSGADAASFDCSKAATPVEHMICASPSLSKLDEQTAVAYANSRQGATLPGSRDAFLRDQRDWLHQRDVVCHDEQCLATSYRLRLERLVGPVKEKAIYQAAMNSRPDEEPPLGPENTAHFEGPASAEPSPASASPPNASVPSTPPAVEDHARKTTASPGHGAEPRVAASSPPKSNGNDGLNVAAFGNLSCADVENHSLIEKFLKPLQSDSAKIKHSNYVSDYGYIFDRNLVGIPIGDWTESTFNKFFQAYNKCLQAYNNTPNYVGTNDIGIFQEAHKSSDDYRKGIMMSWSTAFGQLKYEADTAQDDLETMQRKTLDEPEYIKQFPHSNYDAIKALLDADEKQWAQWYEALNKADKEVTTLTEQRTQRDKEAEERRQAAIKKVFDTRYADASKVLDSAGCEKDFLDMKFVDVDGDASGSAPSPREFLHMLIMAYPGQTSVHCENSLFGTTKGFRFSLGSDKDETTFFTRSSKVLVPLSAGSNGQAHALDDTGKTRVADALKIMTSEWKDKTLADIAATLPKPAAPRLAAP